MTPPDPIKSVEAREREARELLAQGFEAALEGYGAPVAKRLRSGEQIRFAEERAALAAITSALAQRDQYRSLLKECETLLHERAAIHADDKAWMYHPATAERFVVLAAKITAALAPTRGEGK